MKVLVVITVSYDVQSAISTIAQIIDIGDQNPNVVEALMQRSAPPHQELVFYPIPENAL